jgi:hypothetical protein
MKRLFHFTLLGLILVLAGCVSTQTVVTDKPADTIDLTKLADEIDPGTVAALQGQDDVFIFMCASRSMTRDISASRLSMGGSRSSQ